MGQKTTLEDKFVSIIETIDIESPEREFKFLEKRRFRFDFAWPKHKLAVEIEGGTWTGGRHIHPLGFAKDCVKYNLAAIDGWAVLRFTGDHLKNGIAEEQLIAGLEKRGIL